METDDGLETALRRRRREFGAFLRQRRAVLRPTDLGMPTIGRRHVKGLRREEVAASAGIGVSWYTMLEQGRVERVSPKTLDAIAGAMRLTHAEREHLRGLAAVSFSELSADLAPPSADILDLVRAHPWGAFVHSGRFEIAASNAWSNAFLDIDPDAEPAPNLLQIMTGNPRMRERFVAPSWIEVLRLMVGHLRIAYARFDDGSYQRLVNDLCASSPEFHRLWAERPVIGAPPEEHRIVHPVEGPMLVHVALFAAPQCPSYTMVLHRPV